MFLTFSQVINKLNEFWCNKNCILLQGANTEVGAGTLNPATLLGCIENDNYRICYVQPSSRPADGRYGENINRLYTHHQYQVIIKDIGAKENIQNLYLESLQYIGVDFTKNDIRFIEDDWKNPSVGAFGLGWEVWYNGTEVTQFTYMQQLGGISCDVIPVEITYGLERLVMCVQNIENVFDIQYSNDQKYGEFFKSNEYDFSCFALDQADVKLLKRHLEDYMSEGQRFIELKNARLAYDFAIKSSHIINLLDARRVISINERAEFLIKMKHLVQKACLLLIEKKKIIIYDN